MLNDLVSWTHRERFQRQVAAGRIAGASSRWNASGVHSSILEIRNQHTLGQIYIEAGAITHAAVGTLTGENAFYKLLKLTGGEFQVKPFKAPPQRTVQSDWENLLMRSRAHTYDEESRLHQRRPNHPPHSPEKISPPTSPADPTSLGDDIVVDAATYDGQWK